MYQDREKARKCVCLGCNLTSNGLYRRFTTIIDQEFYGWRLKWLRVRLWFRKTFPVLFDFLEQ